MAKDRDELLDHSYDGIREYNNPLPRWWLWLFYATIVFAASYIPWNWLGFGLTGSQQLEQEIAAAKRAAPPATATQPPAPAPGGGSSMPAAAGVPVSTTASVEAGKAIFATNCVPCHGPQGQGVIGPNLTDDYWLHGNTLPDITNTVTNGVPDKGMIAWKTQLSSEKIHQVVTFVMSLHGTNPPNPKPPQGTLYKY